MNTDTHGLTNELKGRQLRVRFRDGEVAEVELLFVDVHENCKFGDEHAEFVYDLIRTNRPEKYGQSKGAAIAASFTDLEKWELLESQEDAAV